MPTKVVTKARPAPPSTKIVVTQQHSYELVRTVVTAAISQIVYLKRFFPDVKYNMCVYDPNDPTMDYESFMQNHGRRLDKSRFTDDGTNEQMVWPILPRKTSNRDVQKLLNCLEIGIADPLQKGYMAQVTLSWHSMDQSPVSEMNLIESYTFFFEDTPNTGSGNNFVVSHQVKQELHLLVQEVYYKVLNNKSYMRRKKFEVPSESRLSLSWLYNSKAPENYQPPGLPARYGDQHTFNILQSSVPDKNISMNTGFTCVSVGICQFPSRDTPPPISTPLPKSTPLPMSTAAETQGIALRALRTIGAHRDPATQDTQFITRHTSTVSRTTSVHAPSHCQQNFLPTYQEDLYTSLIRKLPNISSLPSSGQSKNLCPCGISGDLENLITCQMCQNQYHAQCLGFLYGPPIHVVCISCLNDKYPALVDLDGLAPFPIRRRILFYLYQEGAMTVDALSEMLQRDPEFLGMTLETLVAERYIALTSSKSKKRARQHKETKTPREQTISLVADEKKLLEKYFDYKVGLEHLFSPISSIPQTPAASSLRKRDYPRGFTDHNIGSGSETQGTPSAGFQTPRPSGAWKSRGGSGQKRMAEEGLGGHVAKRPFSFLTPLMIRSQDFDGKNG